MKVDRYRLDQPLRSGRDGVAFAAWDEEAQVGCEVRMLAAAHADPLRWPALRKRLKHAALVKHARAAPVFKLHLQESPPFVVVPAGEALPPPPWLPEKVRDAAVALAGALAAAHRVGFVHGAIAPSRLQVTASGDIALDFTGIECAPAAAEPAFVAPEVAAGQPPDAVADVFSLGQVLAWLGRGAPVRVGWNPAADAPASALDSLIARMVALEPSDRPTAAEALGDLQLHAAASVAQTAETQEDEAPPKPEMQLLDGRTLGRFQLLELVGEGGLGQVYRAQDVADGTIVAVKVLHAHQASRDNILKRFQKEARLLGEVHNPYVARFIEVNQDAGLHYLAQEFIDGRSVSSLLRDADLCPHGHWDEGTALALGIGVARGLAEAHRRGIIHRDIKPHNVMILHGSWLFRRLEAHGVGVKDMPTDLGAKLCDFGLARHIDQSDSMHVTQEGTFLGTPLYMSPEQALGTADLGPTTDIYSLGVTLFHVLTGRPPFQGESALTISMKHAKEAPPTIQSLNPSVSDGLARIIHRCLAKQPQDRPADAAELLEELERHARGEPAAVAAHPRLPKPGGTVLQYDWTWELNAAPEQLWPHVSNTERLNRAAGVPAVEFRSEAVEATVGDGVRSPLRRFGMFKVAGMTNAWQEHPFEWVEGRRLGVLREYSAGVFKWLASIVELEPRPDGGCTLTHRVRVEPRHIFGRWIAALEVGIKGRRRVERVYRRIDAYLTGQLTGSEALDPFEPPADLSRGQRQRLDNALDRLARRGVPPAVLAALGEYLRFAPAQEAARIRPLALAKRLQVPADELLAACLRGAQEGLFVLMWDLVCPLCRIPAGIVETLQALKDHGHCQACQTDFPLDFGESVELIFRVHPNIRPVETRTYCVGGPAHSPHVAAQVRIAAGERLEADLALGEGAYRVRSPQLPFAGDLLVDSQSSLTRWTYQVPVDFTPDPEQTAPAVPRLRAGRQRLVFDNHHREEIVLRVERRADRTDALTAARASTSALFRELFPGEVLEAGRLVSVASMTFLAADLGQISNLETADSLYQKLEEPRVFALLHDHCVLADECLRQHHGAVIKTIGETVLAVFDDESAALAGALAWHDRLCRELRPRWPAVAERLRLRIGLHQGAALAATINGRLDYFGATVDQALKLPGLGEPDHLLVTRDLATDPQFTEELRKAALNPRVAERELPGQTFGLLLTAQLPASHRVG